MHREYKHPERLEGDYPHHHLRVPRLQRIIEQAKFQFEDSKFPSRSIPIKEADEYLIQETIESLVGTEQPTLEIHDAGSKTDSENATRASLDFSPEDLDTETITMLLEEQTRYDQPQFNSVLDAASEYYLSEVQLVDIDAEDILNIREIAIYNTTHKDELMSYLEELNEVLEFDPYVAARSTKPTSMSFREAREKLRNREELLREASEGLSSSEDGTSEFVLNQSLKQYSFMMLGSMGLVKD